MPYSKESILSGRKAIEAYRVTHNQLRPKPTEHTILLEKMIADLKAWGFNCGDGITTFSVWDEFNTASELLNVQELGFTSFEDYEKRCKPKDERLLDGKWH